MQKRFVVSFFPNNSIIKNRFNLDTVQTVPCTLLHGIGAKKVMISGHLPLAEGDFQWADAVTVRAHRVCTVT
ncbi:hypothetical protein DWX43_25805 [Clostridium sp. AF19-22AC]|nr:hypothetical protein DWX43_25805 [Clostridium sp. AF19-22AC]